MDDREVLIVEEAALIILQNRTEAYSLPIVLVKEVDVEFVVLQDLDDTLRECIIAEKRDVRGTYRLCTDPASP